jgi:hypothetical protein
MLFGSQCVCRDFTLQFHLTRKETTSRASARQKAIAVMEMSTPSVPEYLDVPEDFSASFMPPRASTTGSSMPRSPVQHQVSTLLESIPDVSVLTMHGVDVEGKEAADSLLRGSSVGLAHVNVSVVALKIGSPFDPPHLRCLFQKLSRSNPKLRESYMKFAAHNLESTPTEAAFGMLRVGTEYCLPISLKNVGLGASSVFDVWLC